MRGSVLLLSALLCLPGLAQDKAGCKDHPLFPTRMPSYDIETCKQEAFAAYEFFGLKGTKTRQEGAFTFITYRYTGPKGSEPSGLAVVRNYQNALTRIGGTVNQTDPDRWVNGKILKDGQEVWMQAEKGNGKIWLRIIEKKAMEQFIVADAAAFGNDLRATGHASVYGILFDFNKSEVKPESAPALVEIARLLEQNPAFKVKVVGHTDMVGGVEANLKLSQARAEAVVRELVTRHRVAPDRLKAHGVGPLCPVSTNDTEAGRAKNRRVELVKE